MTPIAIFARAPIPGFAKTRLIPRLGADGAARLHGELVVHALATAQAARLGPVTLWSPPENDGDAFLSDVAQRFGAARALQSGGDLGARMLAAFEAEAPLLLMGSDAPAITPEDLRACARALGEHADAVFLPAEDGGYALVGARRPIPEIFTGMTWGDDRVMASTRARLTALGLAWAEPRVVWDVDRPEDYERLVAEAPAFALPTATRAD